MSQKKISELFPEKLMGVRLGTCYDVYSKELISSVAFKLESIPNHLRTFNAGSGSISFSANSSSSVKAFEDFIGIDAKIEKGFASCKASAGFNMSLANATSSDNQSICGYLAYTVKNGSIEVRKATPETLYNCMTEDFKKLYKQFVEAKPNNKLRTYLAFTKFFGQGVVTKINLTSGAFGKFEIVSSDVGDANDNKYGASLAIGVPSGSGASAAVNWGNSSRTATKNASLKIEADWYPVTSPAKAWAMEVYNLGKEIGLDILKDKAKLPSVSTIEKPTAPDFPTYDEPEAEDVPEDNPDTDDEDLDKLLDDLRLKDGEEAKRMSNKKWQESIKELKNTFEIINLIEETKKIPLSGSIPTISLKKEGIKNESLGEFVSELGDYIPCGFEITPWEELFPALKFKIVPTFSAFNMAKINMFYYSRLQFGQYLKFLSDLPLRYTNNNNLETETGKYLELCDAFINKALITMNTPPFDDKKYKTLIKSFDAALNKLKTEGFFESRKVYDTFFDNYHFFVKNAYGFVPYFQNLPEFGTVFPKLDVRYRFMAGGNPNQQLSKIYDQAVRYYPVISQDGKLRLVHFRSNSWLHDDVLSLTATVPCTVIRIITPTLSGVKDFKNLYKSSTKSYNLEDQTMWQGTETMNGFENMSSLKRNIHLKGLGFKDISSQQSVKIRGIAMFSDYPFEDCMNILGVA